MQLVNTTAVQTYSGLKNSNDPARGKPVVVEEEISVAEAARILGLSYRHIESQCALGISKPPTNPEAALAAAGALLVMRSFKEKPFQPASDLVATSYG